MRTSSIKSAVSMLLLAATITVAVPAADARPAREVRAQRGDSIVQVIVNFVKRIGDIASYARPSIPLGSPEEDSGETTTTVTDDTTSTTDSSSGTGQ